MDNTGIKNVGQINIAENGGHINVYNVNRNTPKVPADFSSYYNNVKRKFTREKRGVDAELVGVYSDEEAYIDAYIRVNDYHYYDNYNNYVSVLSYLGKWFCEYTFGTTLLHGEPGHGKTTLCNKAVFEYCKGSFLTDKATNVLAVSLSTGDNPRIIEDGMVVLENALTWRGENKTFTFEDCRGALLFMDGYDEFIDEAKKANIKDIVSFMKLIDEIADAYDIHIVVLSRTIVVESYLEELGLAGKSYKLLPITTKQQDDWLDQHREYNDYKRTFYKLRNNGYMRGLFEIPFLFRLIVHSRFSEVSTNVVELYGKLFKHLMSKRDVYGTDLETVIVGLENLAYDIYCDDTDTAVVDKKERDKKWIVVFYLKAFKNRRMGFYHRSFYQYFLARYIYDGILNLTNDKAETYISYFAERELDATVCRYLSLMHKEDEKETVYSNLQFAIEALVRTEADLNLEPRCSSGDAEKKRIIRIINIVRNILKICAVFDYVIQIPFKDNIDIILRLYPCRNIRLFSKDNQRANLIGANLIGGDLSRADLKGADLIRADLSRANLSRAELCNADLSRANLYGTNLSGANLSGANLNRANLYGANLSGANLSGANLSGANLSIDFQNKANLSEADLSEADLCRANLYGAKLNRANLSEADLSGADLNRADLNRADLSRANLSETYLIRVDLSKAKLNGAKLEGANLSRANLSEADLSGADLIRADLSGAKLSGANLNGAELEGANLIGADLIGAKLSRAKLEGANLIGADLSGTDLSRADLGGVKLSEANLFGANLFGANLFGANLIGADLGGTDLSKVNLSGTVLVRTNLRKANLSEAKLSKADLSRADLREANLNGALLFEANLDMSRADNMIINSIYKKYIDSSVGGYDAIQWI